MMIETEYRALRSAGQEGLPLRASGAVVVIGNFDGVHRGHRALLAHGRRIADQNGWRLVVLTFTPHPRSFFKPDQPPFLLTSTAQKAALLADAGADDIVVLRFDGLLSQLSPQEFITHVLEDGLCARHVVVGENFVFGKSRAGDITTLRGGNYAVTALPPVLDETGERISSQRIREALRLGQIATAEALLGRPWELQGTVVRGNQQGRVLGFPTANMALGEYLHPKFGVYQARVLIEDDPAAHPAVVNIGQRPTIGISGPLLEAHLLDYSGDLYGKTVRVTLGDFLRPERKFGNLDGLKEQIQKDVAWARELFSGHKP